MRNIVSTKQYSIVTVILLLLIACAGSMGCRGTEEADTKSETVEIKKGNILETVSSDGHLVMPREFELRFGTFGTVKEVLVEEGDVVKEGTLLARLDNTKQKIAVEKDLYALQKKLNDLAEKSSCGCSKKLDYPNRYANVTALYIFEQSQREVNEAKTLLDQRYYKEAAIKLRLAHHDMDTAVELLNTPIPDFKMQPDIMGALNYKQETIEPAEYGQMYPITLKTIDLINQAQEKLTSVRGLMGQGDYAAASSELAATQKHMEETYRAVKGTVGQIVRFNVSYPDTATSLDFMNLAKSLLQETQYSVEQGNLDTVQLAKYLRTAQHELEIARNILTHNELVFESGLNLTEVQTYNLNLQKAMIALHGHSADLMKTEILAPIDGTVVDVGVMIDDQLSSFDYSSTTAIELVDTHTVKFEGVIDEVDIFKVKLGQKANIIVDAVPDEILTGTITFISPFGTETADVLNFAITIELDPTDIELKGDMTATADILIQDKKDVLLIPTQAIIETPRASLALVVTDETVEPERRRIVLGARTYEFAEVKSGLEEGEKVLIITEELRKTLRAQGPQGPPGAGGGQRPPGAGGGQG